MDKFKEQLQKAVRTKTRVIFVSTPHEYTTNTKLVECFNDTNHIIITKTLIDEAPLKSLAKILETPEDPKKDSRKKIYIFNDIYQSLENQNSEHYYFSIRLINELIYTYRNHIVIITIPMSFVIPKELQTDITIIEDFLLTQKEIKEEIENNIKRNDRWKEVFKDIDIDRVSFACQGLSFIKIVYTISGLVSSDKLPGVDIKQVKLTTEMIIDEINKEKVQVIKSTNVLELINQHEFSIDDLGGYSNLKNWLEDRKETFNVNADNSDFPYFLQSPKGVLLVGIQGTGKSLTAKAIGSAWNLPIVKLDIGKLFNKYVGSSEHITRDTLKLVEAVSPCVLWIDEIEKQLSTGNGDGGTSLRVLGTILTWIQENKSSTFIVATANNIEKIPPELFRKGRFDECFFLDFPGEREREEIFKIHLKKQKIDDKKINLSLLVQHTENFVGSEIEQAIKNSVITSYKAFRNKEDFKINTEKILTEIKNIVPLSKTMSEQIDYLRSWAKDKFVRAND